MAQLVTRIDESLARRHDDLDRDGVARTRSDTVRIGLEQLIERHRREQVGLAIDDASRRSTQTDGEQSGPQEATRALVEEEPW
jgi:hypothetical protein